MPASSATARNVAGLTGPVPGRIQRTSASTAEMPPVFADTTGW